MQHKRNFANATQLVGFGVQKRVNSLMASIVENQKTKMKFHNRESVVQNIASPLKSRLSPDFKKKIFGSFEPGIVGSSTIDILQMREKLNNKNMKDSDVSALYIPKARLDLKNVSQKKKDQIAKEVKDKKKKEQLDIQKML